MPNEVRSEPLIVGCGQARGDALDFYERIYEKGAEYSREVLPENEKEILALLERFPPGAGGVVEIGAGNGALQGVHERYVGIDISHTALRRNVSRPSVAASAEQLPLRDGSVPFLLTVATFEHVPHPGRAFEEVHRVLAPGGVAYLAPAWFCRPWASEGLNVRPYRDLTPLQRLRKASIPIRNSLVYRSLFVLPKRILREMTTRFRPGPTQILYRKLKPNYNVYWCSDSDATCSIDPHEAILFFRSRGYETLTAPRLLRRLIVRHVPVVVRKGVPRP